MSLSYAVFIGSQVPMSPHVGSECRVLDRHQTPDSVCHVDVAIATHPIGHCGERWSRGRAPDCQSRGQSIPPTAVSKLRQFLHPTFACVFRKRH